MHKGRLEAFSDAVIAIVMTVMVLELVPPHGATIDDLAPLAPIWLAYVLSFLYLGIYWNNHHHLLQVAQRVDGAVLWANLFLLFWLSLIPFTTGWIGESAFAPVPMAAYGVVLLLAAVAYFLLVRALIRCQPDDSLLAAAIGRDVKGIGSAIAYLLAVPLALVLPLVAFAIYLAVAIVWVVPDRRMERAVEAADRASIG
jgi:uncharacterized membrane protein